MTIMDRKAAKFWRNEDWPPEIAYKYYEGCYSGLGITPEWKIVTYAELLAKKIARQSSKLNYKRRPDQYTLPAFIWVFKNVHAFPFGGWWIYLKTLKNDYPLNFRCSRDHVILRIMERMPLGMMPIKQNIEPWMKEFAQRYPHSGFKRKRFQGLLKCFVTFDHKGEIVDVNLLQ